MNGAIIGPHIVQKPHSAPKQLSIAQSKNYIRKNCSHIENGPTYIPKVLM
jgi:hypothetical protein